MAFWNYFFTPHTAHTLIDTGDVSNCIGATHIDFCIFENKNELFKYNIRKLNKCIYNIHESQSCLHSQEFMRTFAECLYTSPSLIDIPILYAAQHHKNDIVRWIHEKYFSGIVTETYIIESLIYVSYKYCNTDLLNWLYSVMKAKQMMSSFKYSSVQVFLYNNVKLLEWTCIHFDDLMINGKTNKIYRYLNRIGVTLPIHEIEEARKNEYTALEEIFINATNIEIYRYLDRIGIEFPMRIIESAYKVSVLKEDPQIFMWLKEKYNPDVPIESIIMDIIDIGNITILNYLHQKGYKLYKLDTLIYIATIQKKNDIVTGLNRFKSL